MLSFWLKLFHLLGKRINFFKDVFSAQSSAAKHTVKLLLLGIDRNKFITYQLHRILCFFNLLLQRIVAQPLQLPLTVNETMTDVFQLLGKLFDLSLEFFQVFGTTDFLPFK